MALTLNGTTGIAGIAGSAGTPALQGNNDANTGYFFATDTLGLSTAGSERLRVDSAGRLLVGLTSDSRTTSMVISGNTSGSTSFGMLNIDIGTTSVSADTNIGIIRFGATGDRRGADIRGMGEGTWNAGSSHPTRLSFYTCAASSTSPTERFRIDSSGNLTAGFSGSITNGYNYELRHSATYAIKFSNASNNKHVRIGCGDPEIGSTGGEFDIRTTDTNAIKFKTDNSERFRIHSTGELQIGDSTKSALSDRVLQIGKTDRSATYLEIRSATTGATGVVFSDGTAADNSGYRGTVEYNHNDDSLKFKTAGTDRLYITSTGNVGIASASPGCKLVSIQSDTSNGNNVILDNWYNANATTTFLKAYRQGGAVGYALQYKDSATRIRQGTYTNHAMELITNDNARITIANDGHVVLSNSIAFKNETSVNNRLDDYEEGEIALTSASGGLSLTVNSSGYYSRYIKIGHLVHIQFYIGVGSATHTSSNLILSGLPFPVASGQYAVGSIDIGKGGIKGTYIRALQGTDDLEFFYSSESVGTSRYQLAGNQVGTSTYLIGTISYYTTS